MKWFGDTRTGRSELASSASLKEKTLKKYQASQEVEAQEKGWEQRTGVRRSQVFANVHELAFPSKGS